MKRYFINITYSTNNFSKYAWTVVKADLSKTTILDVAKDVIRDSIDELEENIDTVNINVTAFNEL